jgi:hypothetical protein
MEVARAALLLSLLLSVMFVEEANNFFCVVSTNDAKFLNGRTLNSGKRTRSPQHQQYGQDSKPNESSIQSPRTQRLATTNTKET